MPSADSWTLLHAQVHQTLRSRHLTTRGQRLLLAVSGGQDSLCLAQLFLDLQSKWNWDLAIVHCDHGWRSDSVANAEYVAELAQTWQIPYYSCRAETPPRSEAEARQWRYQVFGQFALQQDYGGVLTGHTASDRAETLLYNLMRGSGADGLQALTWKRSLQSTVSGVGCDRLLIRPLLGITRRQTGQFCQERDLKIWEDTTNQDNRYARNRIRQDLLPYLAAHFNPQVELALAQTAELLQADVAYLEQEAQRLWEQVVHSEAGTLQLHRLPLRAVPLALQRRVMRQLLQKILLQSPNFEQIEKLVALIDAPNRSRTDPFPGGAIAEVEGEWIRFGPLG